MRCAFLDIDDERTISISFLRPRLPVNQTHTSVLSVHPLRQLLSRALERTAFETTQEAAVFIALFFG